MQSWQGSKSCKAVVRLARALKLWHTAGTYHTVSTESQPSWEHDAGHAAEPVIDWWAKSTKASRSWHATAGQDEGPVRDWWAKSAKVHHHDDALSYHHNHTGWDVWAKSSKSFQGLQCQTLQEATHA